MERRDFLVTTGAVTVTALTAGCTDLIFGDGIEESAKPASINDDTLDRTGFTETGVEGFVIEEEVSFEDTSREVVVESWLSGFRRDESTAFEEVEEASTTVTLFTTPSATVAGQELNPAAKFSDERVIEYASDEFDDGEINEITEEDMMAVEILGEAVEVTIFSAVLTVDGTEHDIVVYVGEVTNEDDLVIPIAVHHELVDEEDTIKELMEGIEHPVSS